MHFSANLFQLIKLGKNREHFYAWAGTPQYHCNNMGHISYNISANGSNVDMITTAPPSLASTRTSTTTKSSASVLASRFETRISIMWHLPMFFLSVRGAWRQRKWAWHIFFQDSINISSLCRFLWSCRVMNERMHVMSLWVKTLVIAAQVMQRVLAV